MRATSLLFLGALGVSGCQLVDTDPGPSPSIRSADASRQLLGRNPWAARQRTPAGRQIHTVEYLDGQVYVGFGDWRANTGPIAVTSWDVASGEWVHHLSAATEAIERFHSLPSGLLLPYTDPERRVDFAQGPLWQEGRASAAGREAFSHVFGAVETAAGVLLVGTRRRTGEPLVQHWNGTAWGESLLLAGKADWFWFAAVLNDEVVVQSETQGAFRFDGNGWRSTEPLFDNPRARAVISLQGRAASITRQNGAGQLQTSNGSERTRETQADAWDLNLDQASGWAYLLRSDRLERSRDLVVWEIVPVEVPPGASALDVAEGRAWIGTRDSTLWVVRLPGLFVRSASPRHAGEALVRD